MSLALPDAREQAMVEEAARTTEAVRARPLLFVGGHDVTGFFEDGKWVQGPDEYPITLEATLGAVLPRRYEGEAVELYAEVEGVVVEQMLAPSGASEIEVGEDLSSTELLAGTAGVLLERLSLGERVEYPGWSVSHVVLDAVRRAGAYDMSQVEVEPVAAPEVHWVRKVTGDEGFGFSEKIADILSRVDALGQEGEVEQQAPLLMRDTARNGFVSRLRRGLSPDGAKRVYDWRDLPRWKPPKRKSALHSDVGVFRLLENGEPAYVEIAPVEYRGRGVPPRPGTTLWIPFADASAAGAERARQRAYDGAERLARGEYVGETELPGFDALLEKGDPFVVLEVFRDDEASWDRAWLFEVLGFEKPYDKLLGLGPPVVAYEGVLLHEDEIKAPVFVGLARATGPSVVAPLSPAYGLDDGFWVDVSVQDPDYIAVDAVDGLWVDPQIAAGRAGFDASIGLWILVPAGAPPGPVYGFDADGFWINPLAQDPEYIGVNWTDGLWVDPQIADGAAGFDATDGLWLDEPPYVALAMFGNDDAGFFIDPAYPGGFAGNDADGFWIDEAASSGETGNDADGFWVDI